MAPASDGDPNTQRGRYAAHHDKRTSGRPPTVAAFWIIAGIIAVIVVGDPFTLLALAIVTTAWWNVRDLDFAHGRKRSGRPVARKPPRNSPDVAGWSRRGVASD
jgi:hypothetical protein